MKRKNLLVSLAVVAQALSFSAFADQSFPSDAEASYDLPAIETRADSYARMGEDLGAAWGVSPRGVAPHDPFPFGGGPVDD
jgi:hypothetical protein